MVRLSHCLTVALLIAAGPVMAGESLINGAPLEYNREYHCGGRRIIVSMCGNKDDSGYCQVYYYPDSATDNRMLGQPVEQRGAIIQKLAACAAPATQQAAPQQGVTATKRAATAGRATATKAETMQFKAPGLGKAIWKFLAWDKESATYFTDAGIRRTSTTHRGWFTYVFARPHSFSSLPGTPTKFMQVYQSADCAANTTFELQAAWYDEEGKLIRELPLINEEPVRPPPGTVSAFTVNIMCGRPQEILLEESPPVDGQFLASAYAATLDVAAHQTGKQ